MTRVPLAFTPSPILTQPALREAFLEALGRLGDVGRAAAEIGVPRTSLYKARLAYPEFAHGWAAVLRHRPGARSERQTGVRRDGGARPDGLWSLATRSRFLAALTATGDVPQAAAAANKSADAAYHLRRSDAGFAADWDAAFDRCIDTVEAGIVHRALHGEVRPVFYGGKQIGEIREFSDAAAMFLLRSRRRAIYGTGKLGEPATPVDPPLSRDELMARLRKVMRQDAERHGEVPDDSLLEPNAPRETDVPTD